MVRRQLGRRLKKLREDAGKTIKSVQDAKLPVKVGDVWTLCRFYHADNDVTDALALLSEGTSSDGWWEEYGDAVPEWFGLYIGLEGSCQALSYYHPELVHGLLQTEDFARAWITTDGLHEEEVIERRLKLRMDRKRATLDRLDRKINAIIGPGALSLQVGTEQVRADQYTYLCALNAMDGISIRVLPWAVGAHPGIHGSFTILDFDDPNDPSVIYLESLMGARYLEQPHQIAEYRRIFRLLEQQALPIQEYSP
jgi:hypothetical protein